jgi:peptidyl-tRNA hydrolase, PTH1 family
VTRQAATTTPSDLTLIVGLGNPGPKYAGTRHNAGFLVVDELAARHGGAFTKERHAVVARTGKTLLVKPTTFMNLSGTAVQALMTRHGVRPEGLVVVHDDLDLPLGRIRLRSGGGAGGQRGVQDIIARIGGAFARVRIGIGRPPADWGAERWVLSPFGDDEGPLVTKVVATAADAVDLLLQGGLERAMGAFNGVDLAAPPAPPPSEAVRDAGAEGGTGGGAAPPADEGNATRG